MQKREAEVKEKSEEKPVVAKAAPEQPQAPIMFTDWAMI